MIEDHKILLKEVDCFLLKTKMDTLQSIILLPYELTGDELNAFIVLSSGKTLNSVIRTLNQRVENLLLLLMVI